MNKLISQHQRPLQRILVPLNPALSRHKPFPELDHYNVLLPPGKGIRPEQAEIFLRNTKGLEYQLSWVIFVVNTGECVTVHSQLSAAPNDATLLESLLNLAFPEITLEQGIDIFKVLLGNLFRNEEMYRQYEFELCDFNDLKRNMLWTNFRLLAVGRALMPGEAIFQDISIAPDNDDTASFQHVMASLRYGFVARKGRMKNIKNALLGTEENYYSWADFRRMGYTWKHLWKLLCGRKICRKGFKTTPKNLKSYFIIPWTPPAYKTAGMKSQEVYGNKPHPDLYSGIPIGYSLYDNSQKTICIPFEFARSSSWWFVGKTGFGKSSAIENIAHYYMNSSPWKRSLMVIDYKYDLVDRLMGMVNTDRLDEVVRYAPAKSSFHCNIIQGLPVKELVTILARTVEARHEYGLTSNVVSLLQWSARALHKWSDSITLRHIKAFVADKKFRDEVLNHNPDPEVFDYVTNILPNIPQTSRSALFTKCELFLNKPLINATCQKENLLNLAELFSEEKLVFADLSELTQEEISDIGTCLFAHATLAAFNKKYSTQDITVRIIMDEFQNIYHPALFSQLLSQGRAFNLSVLAASQGVFGQLDRKTAQNVAGNTGVRLCFRLEEKEDVQFLSYLLKVPPMELTSLEKYEAYLQVGTYPAVKIRTLPPVQFNQQIRDQAVKASDLKYKASEIDNIDPYKLFDESQQKPFEKREYDEI
ncbi:type IV secretory system conjugative DNA transfer family protein [Candidatus Latescibacterota bacterium]